MNIPNIEQIIIKDFRLQKGQQIHAWSIMMIPLLGFFFTLYLGMVKGIFFWEMMLLIAFYWITMTGIEVGFHRFFSHQAFQSKPILQILLGVAGSMAAQGPLIYWVANHRRHHQFSDHGNDPHSPYYNSKGIHHPLKGLWHAHMGWAFHHESTNTALFAKDLLKNVILFKISRLYYLWIFIGLVLPALLGLIITRTWGGAFHGFLWGGLARIFLVQHFTFLVNSICHVYGHRPHPLPDKSGNVFLLSLPTLGGSWHNNHHAYPNSAKLGFERWQIDLGGWMIEILKKIGMISKMKVHQERVLS